MIEQQEKSAQVLEKCIYKKHFVRFATGYTDFHSWSDMKITQKLREKYEKGIVKLTAEWNQTHENKSMMIDWYELF